jgi:glycosyltransferase involved in cell wall biosynthesis
MTTRCMGLDEDAFVEANSRSAHAWHECLRRLRAECAVDGLIVLLTEGRPRSLERAGLCWRFVPATWAALHRARPWRRLFGRAEYQFSLALLDLLRREPPDLFVFYGNLPTPFARWIAARLVKRGIPYVAMIHGRLGPLALRGPGRPGEGTGTLAGRLAGSLRTRELEFLFGHAAAVLPLTDGDRDRIVAAGMARPERVSVLPPGIAPLPFHPDPAEPKDPWPALCFAGRLSEAKGFLDALDCLAGLRRRFPQARLHAAGQWLDRGYEALVHRFLTERGLDDAVTFHGYLAPEDLARLYRQCHLMLFPSRSEGLPRAALEAMMSGLPVAAIAGTGGLDEVIADGHDGILTSRDRLADRVLGCLEDPTALAAMGERAVARVAQRYSFETMYAQARALYLGLLGGSDGGTGRGAGL